MDEVRLSQRSTLPIVIHPTRRSIVLGVLLDTLSITASLPQEKIDADLFNFNAALNRDISLSKLQSITGKPN